MPGAPIPEEPPRDPTCGWNASGHGWRDHWHPCSDCGLKPTEEGHDACIQNLAGVFCACCGHGDPDAGPAGYERAYAMLWFSPPTHELFAAVLCVRGSTALRWMRPHSQFPYMF